MLDAFETAMHGLVRRLGTSHTGFFHQSVRRVPARLAVGASFSRHATDGGAQWVASDVHSGGPADLAGLESGDVLVSVNDRPILPPDQPMFAMGAEFALAIRRADEQHTLRVVVPLPRSTKQPYCEPRAVQSSKLDQNTGYLKVSILPGLLGLDVARENLTSQIAAEQVGQLQKLRELQLEDMTGKAAYQGYVIQRQAASEAATQHFFNYTPEVSDGTTFQSGWKRGK